MQLIISADDYGRSAAVNEAIIKAAALGVVTSTSVMVNMPASERVSELRQVSKDISTGLHLNLTEGRPVLAPSCVRSLVDESGNFLGLRRFVARILTMAISQNELRLEIAAQIARCRRLAGRVSHIDSHKHIHVIPGVLRPLAEVARDNGIERIRAPRRMLVHSRHGERSHAALLVRRLLANPAGGITDLVKTLDRRLIQRLGLVSPDWLISPAPLIPAQPLGAALDAWHTVMSRMPQGVGEVNFHPGVVAGEGELLESGVFARSIRDNNVQLINYWQVRTRTRGEAQPWTSMTA